MYRDSTQPGRSRSTGCSHGRASSQAGHPEPIAAAREEGRRSRRRASRCASPSIARATELIEAGLNVEAGEELEQNEKEILKHLGGDKALPWLIDLYKRAGQYHRVYRLGVSRGRRRAGRRSGARRGDARRCGRWRLARLSAARRASLTRWQEPRAASLLDHAQGIRLRAARRLVRRRAGPPADDPADQHAGRGGDRRALLLA